MSTTTNRDVAVDFISRETMEKGKVWVLLEIQMNTAFKSMASAALQATAADAEEDLDEEIIISALSVFEKTSVEVITLNGCSVCCVRLTETDRNKIFSNDKSKLMA